MAFTTLSCTQKEFLVNHLRGTGVELTAAQAQATYGIQNIRARMTEIRQSGLVVRTRKNYAGRTAYAVSARDVFGSRAKAL
jgi:hypothetical protein